MTALPYVTAIALLALPGAAIAQQSDGGKATQSQSGSNGAMAKPQNQANPNQANAGGADITVQQKPAQITVQQPAPQVTVNQPPPQVKVEQPKPDVNVRQAEPNVTVNQSGKPDVNVVPGNAGGTTTRQSGTTGTANQATGASDAMKADQAEQLIGKSVVSSGGRDMGEVNNLIVDGRGQVKGAVVQWGGFLGIGDKERVVPWDQVRYDHAGNRAIIDMTKDQIRALPEYDGPRSLADMGADARPLR